MVDDKHKPSNHDGGNIFALIEPTPEAKNVMDVLDNAMYRGKWDKTVSCEWDKTVSGECEEVISRTFDDKLLALFELTPEAKNVMDVLDNDMHQDALVPYRQNL